MTRIRQHHWLISVKLEDLWVSLCPIERFDLYAVWKVFSTFCSKRQKVWQTLESLSFSYATLCKRGEFAHVVTVNRQHFTLSCQAPDSSLCCSTRHLVFTKINLKPALLLFAEFCVLLGNVFRLCDVYRFQNWNGLELPIKHTLRRTD